MSLVGKLFKKAKNAFTRKPNANAAAQAAVAPAQDDDEQSTSSGYESGEEAGESTETDASQEDSPESSYTNSQNVPVREPESSQSSDTDPDEPAITSQDARDAEEGLEKLTSSKRKSKTKAIDEAEASTDDVEESVSSEEEPIVYTAETIRTALTDSLADALKHQEHKIKKGVYKNIGGGIAHVVGVALAFPTFGGSLLINAGAAAVNWSGANNIKHARADKKKLLEYQNNPINDDPRIQLLERKTPYGDIPYKALALAFNALQDNRGIDPANDIPVSHWLKALVSMYEVLDTLPKAQHKHLEKKECKLLTQAFANTLEQSVGRAKGERVAHWADKNLPMTKFLHKKLKAYDPKKPLSEEKISEDRFAALLKPFADAITVKQEEVEFEAQQVKTKWRQKETERDAPPPRHRSQKKSSFVDSVSESSTSSSVSHSH